MAVIISSTNYNNQNCEVTIYSPTGNTLPYTSATTINIGSKTIPFTYTSDTISEEYGIFSCNFTGYNSTCEVTQLTPPDGDGNRYRTIKIGDQVWMAENLKTTKFRDGTPLDNASPVDNATWTGATGPTTRYWAYVNTTFTNSANTETYGLVYNQYAVTGSTSGSTDNVNLCPSGWHVPNSTEFTTLNTYLLGFSGTPFNLGDVGTQMKSPTLWTPSGGIPTGTNSSGFDGRPAGTRFNSTGSYANISLFAYYWSITAGVIRRLYYDFTLFGQNSIDSRYGFSVRCLRN
jgi:uncharacterized protein (TIGR02145 family)